METTRRSEEAENSPAKKRLRCTDPDLKIVLKYVDDDGKAARKEYNMYSQLLAHHSHFVDTSLSVEMKERATQEIVFSDTTPYVFELALKFLQDPLGIRLMKPKDAMQLVEFYDKYEFRGGLRMCDEVLNDYMDAEKAKCLMSQPPDNLDLLVNAIALADKFQLAKSKDRGIQYLQSRFNCHIHYSFGPTMFSIQHIKILHPIFKRGIFNHLFTGLTQEDVESPLFPKYLIAIMSEEYCARMCYTFTVKGTGCDVDGKYERNNERSFVHEDCPNARWNGIPVKYYIERRDDHSGYWVILAKSRQDGDVQILWECPHTYNLEWPPRGPWLPVDVLSKLKPSPKVKCITVC